MVCDGGDHHLTYVINRSQSVQIFCPGGKPFVDGGAGRSTGAITCFVTGVDTLCESVSTKIDHVFIEFG